MSIRTRTAVPAAPRTRARPSSLVLGTVAVLALALAGCGGGAAASPSADAGGVSPTPGQSLAPEPSVGSGDGEGVPAAVRDAAVADAAGRAGVDPSAVTVVVAESVTFPDGSLGCPEPGMLYTQVVTPGYHVVVEAAGQAYDYRASARGGPVTWCENPPAG